MPVDLRQFMEDQVKASFDPTGQFRATIRSFQGQQRGDLTTISTSSPVLQVLEVGCAQIGAFIEIDRGETQAQYPTSAKTHQDLYKHMASIHYTNIFNLPSSTTFTLALNKKEVLSKLVPIPGTRSKKLTIPRNSYFKIAGYEFGIHYPIDIIQNAYGGLRVVWDLSEPTDLLSVPTNILKTRITRPGEDELLSIDIPVQQFSIVSKTPTVVPSQTFRFPVDLDDKFYACRVYLNKSDGTTQEIDVTYKEEGYDPETPTAIVTMTDTGILLRIPQIYITTGKIRGELRVDVYVTKGALETTFEGYAIGSIVPTFRDLNKRAKTLYSAPMEFMGTKLVLSGYPVTGGADAMSFEELRQAVITDGIGNPNLPVTPAQIQNHLVRRGYEIIKNADVVTDRVFLASKNMPAPTDDSLLTAANASIELLNASFSELVGRSFVYDNGNSITITPDAVYRLDNSILTMMTDQEIADLENLRPELRAAAVTRGDYLYSPYYYVADQSKDQFRLAPYYLERPQVSSISFEDYNETTGIDVNTNAYDLIKTKDGFKLRVSVLTNDRWKNIPDSQVFAILSFIPPGEEDRAFLLGTIVNDLDGERVFDFDITTRYQMDERDRIDFRNFKMYDTGDKTIYSLLEQDFEIFYAAKTGMPTDFKISEIDAILPMYLLPSGTVGLTQESITLKFGDALTSLWARGRAIAASQTFQRHEIDVILRYQNDVYAINPENGTEVWFDDQGKPYKKMEHAKGDPQLDSDGNEIIQFPKGSLVYDSEGKPIPLAARYLKNHMDIFTIEGAYRFTTDEIAIKYREDLAATLAYWIVNDLDQINKVTMDRSKTYFYPKTIFGTTEVIVTDGLKRQISAAQRFDVALHIPTEVNADTALKNELRKKTVLTISDYLKNDLLANSELTDILRQAYMKDVMDVQVSYFGTNQDISVMQLVNPVHRCGVRKRLVSRDDEKLVVEEDVTVSFNTL